MSALLSPRSALAPTLFAAACVITPPDPPPDEDTGSDGSAGDEGPPPIPGIINDGLGEGLILGPYWFEQQYAVIIGAPGEDVGALAARGESGGFDRERARAAAHGRELVAAVG